jgi:hypothetical protein
VLGYTPHEGQLIVHRSNASRRIVACGVRWGKSTCGSMEAIAALLEPRPSSLGWIVGPNYQNTERIFGAVVNALHEHFRHRILKYSDREHQISVCNFAGGKSTLCAKSADNPVSLLGEAINWLILDESARVRREVWENHLAQRLIDKRGWALLLSTPKGLNWFHEMFVIGRRGKTPGYESWASPTWQNPHIDRAQIDQEEKTLSREVFEQEFGARFVGEMPDPCEVCGGPSPDVPIVIAARPSELKLRCAVCKRLVDAQGRTRVHRTRDGRPALRIVVIPEEPVTEEDMLRLCGQHAA